MINVGGGKMARENSITVFTVHYPMIGAINVCPIYTYICTMYKPANITAERRCFRIMASSVWPVAATCTLAIVGGGWASLSSLIGDIHEYAGHWLLYYIGLMEWKGEICMNTIMLVRQGVGWLSHNVYCIYDYNTTRRWGRFQHKQWTYIAYINKYTHDNVKK